jgi:lactoylglutathione lyase
MKKLTPNLMVADVNATAMFYQQVFGFQIVATVPDMAEPDSGKWQFAIITREDVTIMFQNQKTLVEDAPVFLGKPMGGTFTLYIDVEDVRGLFEKVKSKVTLLKEGLYETFYGTTEFTIQDPNGYVLTFAQDNA